MTCPECSAPARPGSRYCSAVCVDAAHRREMTMNIKHGNGSSVYGPGVSIELTGDEVATAIDAWLVARGVHVSGARTVTVNGDLCRAGRVYVDPSGFVIHDGVKTSGSGQ